MLRVIGTLVGAMIVAATIPPTVTPQRGTSAKPPVPAARKPVTFPFTTPLTAAEMNGKQAVVNTTLGTIVLDLRPDLAPNHVGYFIKLARDGAFERTLFHRVVRLAIVQGGDPLSTDPAKAKLYGTGGLGVYLSRSSAPSARPAVPLPPCYSRIVLIQRVRNSSSA